MVLLLVRAEQDAASIFYLDGALPMGPVATGTPAAAHPAYTASVLRPSTRYVAWPIASAMSTRMFWRPIL